MRNAASPTTAAGALKLRVPGWMLALIARPAHVFVVASLLFGALCIAANPPLRGPDETAHFVRAWGIGQGIVVPAKAIDDRAGLFLPAELHDQFVVFRTAEHRFAGRPFDYREAFAQLRELPTSEYARPAMFTPYEGSEAYTPIAYLPYALAARIGHAVGLDFVPLSHLMRAVGLIVFTLVAAYAIAVAPVMKWAFFLIAMLPASLYGRTVIGADAGTLAFTLVAAALCLRAAVGARRHAGAIARGFWLTLTMLTKPSQVVFAALEAMSAPPGALRHHWRTGLLVILPGLVLAPLWVLVVSGEMASWRIVEGTGRPAHEFDPVWKLGFMLENPLHFPRLFVVTLIGQFGSLWQQTIGVLGRLDTLLWAWTYPLLSGLLLVIALRRLPLPVGQRRWLLAVNTAVIAGYTLAVYLIMFLTWTPLDRDIIWGVQGRYFVVILPSLAIVMAALVNRDVGAGWRATAALCGAVVSGIASSEALWRVHW